MVVLRCEESIDVQPLYLVSAELDVFDELQMVGYGKSFGTVHRLLFRYGKILERKQIRFSIYFFKMAYENDDSCDCIFWQKWMEGN